MDFLIGTGGELTERITATMLSLAEEFFQTQKNPDLIPVNQDVFRVLRRLHDATVLFRVEEGELVSWVVSVPTQTALMHQFMHSEITERELLERTVVQEQYEALYLCSAFTLAEHRRKGYVLSLFAEALRQIPLVPGAPLFAWPISMEGKMIAEKLHRLLPRPVLIKE
jgi:hypothetical protein